jgi:hypothetical protein
MASSAAASVLAAPVSCEENIDVRYDDQESESASPFVASGFVAPSTTTPFSGIAKAKFEEEERAERIEESSHASLQGRGSCGASSSSFW